MDPKESDLNVLDPQESEVLFCGKRIAVKPIVIGQVPGLVRALKPAIDKVADEKYVALHGDVGELVLNMIAGHGEELIRGVAIAVECDEEFVRKGNPAEFIDLTVRVIHTNRDFFEQQIRPRLANLLAAWKGATAATGSTTSTSSSQGATG